VATARSRTRDKIRGLVLFAPYMGPPDVLEEVQRAGGLCKYRAPAYQASPTGFARANFGWLQKVACETHDPQLWMAVGDEDRLLPADRMLAKHLPNERVLILPGGHGWKVWTPAVGMLAPRVFSE
jgi:pimeloyl-ACP methyl ester carboxylesterase